MYITSTRWQRFTSSGISVENSSTEPPAFGELVNEHVNLVLGADIDAARRVVHQQDAAAGQQPFADRDLLLVAAAEGADAREDARARAPERCPSRSATAAVSASSSIRPKRVKRSSTGSDMLRQPVELEEQPFGLAILGDQADPDVLRAPRRAATSG